MVVQSYRVAVFFITGLVCGLLLSFLSSSTFNASGMGFYQPNGAVSESRTSRITGSVNTSDTTEFRRRYPTSHEHVDNLPVPEKPLKFGDEIYHAHDDEHVAKKLYNTVRVLCWVMTSVENLHKKAVHVRATWGKRCNILLFVSDKEDKKFPAIGGNFDLGRDHLTAKTMYAFDYVYKHHLEEADWFMKADDDTYVILENLRYFLSAHDPSEPVYFGHHFKVIVNQGYFSGGGGYVLSREALQRFGKRDARLCAKDFGAEDVEIGHCMEKLGVKTGDSRDAMGRTRFHCFNPETHIHKGYPDWFLQYDKYDAKLNASDFAITFHYVSVEQLYDLEFYIYHLRPYGIQFSLPDKSFNVPPSGVAVKSTTTTTPSTTTSSTAPSTTTRRPPRSTTTLPPV